MYNFSAFHSGLGFFGGLIGGALASQPFFLFQYKTLLTHQPLAEKVKEVQRLSLRTGDYRNLPNRKTPNQVPYEPLKDADEQVQKAGFYLDDLAIN